VTTPGPVDLAALAPWADRLAAMPSAGSWDRGDDGAGGIRHLPWFEPSDDLLQFLRAAGAAGFVQPVDWMAWAGTPRGLELGRDPAAVATADPGELVLLMTSIVRGDRFSEGTIDDAFERGILEAVCRRAAQLVEGGTS
jgi:hypothetical protein